MSSQEPDDGAEAIIADLDVEEGEQDELMKCRLPSFPPLPPHCLALTALHLAAIQIYESRLAQRVYRKR